MKILVIDDNPLHREAAKAQLTEHDLIVVEGYDEGLKLILNETRDGIQRERNPHEFEVVLVDLLMPASSEQQGQRGEKFVGQEMPVGIFLALLAANNGAKYVGLITDTDHHSHPASACIDHFRRSINIGSTKTFFTNSCCTKRVDPNNLAEETDSRENYVRVKNWAKLLNDLLKA